jgi:BlaI family penicillinase repressor
MGRPPSKYPTELELQILKILWQQSPLLVRDVQAALARDGRDLAKTSIITTLNTMVEKKYLTRKAQANTYLFAPKITESEVEDRVLGDVVNRVFDGSASAVMLKLFEAHEINEADLQELRRRIEAQLENELGSQGE